MKQSPKIFIVFHVLILCLCMVVTPKKVVQSNSFCFLCASTLRKDRVRIFGKSSVDIPGLRSAVDIDVTEFSLIDLSSPLCTVTSNSFVVKNYQVPFLRSKTRLKKTDKGGLRTKRLRKDSTAEEGLIAEKLQR